MRTAVAVLGAALVIGTVACNRGNDSPAPEQAVQTQPQRTDDELVTYVRARLFTNDVLRIRRVDVSADNGVVSVSGEVPSEPIRQQVLEEVRNVEGVTRVQDQIRIVPAPPEADKNAENSSGRGGSDAEQDEPATVTTKILAQYFVTAGVKPWNVDVTTSGTGVVTLEGEVDTAEGRETAERVARQTEGVRSVDNRLRIRGVQPSATAGQNGSGSAGATRPDAWVTAKIQSKYFLSEDVKGRDIDVTTADGVVTLTGTVGTVGERRHALALARSTEGAREVRDQLNVDPSVDSNGESGNARATAPLEDGWITTKLQAQFFVDPDIKGRAIEVSTRRGVVTLEGTVESAAERQAAEEIARESDGVSRVINRLRLEAS